MDGSLPALPGDLKPDRTGGGELPTVLERTSAAACFAADEFFSARISNAETRRAYGRAVGWFIDWCEREDVDLHRVTPGLASRFLRELPVSDATKNQTLAALRLFFDARVTRHAVLLNPFHSVRGVQHQVVDDKTPEISLSQARRLFAAIELDTPMGLRDRAILKRRLASAGLPAHLTPHSFRVMVVTVLLSQNVPVEEVQHLDGHSHPSTTQLNDRRRRRINRSIVERIPF